MMLSTTLTTTSVENSGDDSASFKQFLMQQRAKRPSQKRFSPVDPSSATLINHPKFQRQYLYANNGSILLNNHRSNRKTSSSMSRRGNQEEIRVKGSIYKRKKRLVDSATSDLSSSANFAFTESDNMSSSQSAAPDLKFQRKKFIKCVLKEDTDLLKALVCQNNLLNIRDKHQNTLLHIACGFGRLKSVQTLIKMCPVLIDQVDDKGHNPLDVAIKHGQLEVVKWLLFKTNRLAGDARSINKRSCIHMAAKHGENEILKYLLTEMHRKQISLDIQDLNGNTAAHLAAKYNNLDCLQTLVEFNCDVTIVNKNGHTPCFVAEFYGNHECVHYLMIVETCINLSIKVVRMSRRVRESKTHNEILKSQMDEAILINNEFLNQRENIMSISLDLMKRQMQELHGNLFKELERVHAENRLLVDTIHQLNDAKVKIEVNGLVNGYRKASVLEKEINFCKQELVNTESNCQKILKLDQTRLDNVKTKFDEIKKSMERNETMGVANQDAKSKEHLEVLRKMYQETTHKLMIFRNALKERQQIKQSSSNYLPQSSSTRSVLSNPIYSNTELRVSNKPLSSSPSHFQPNRCRSTSSSQSNPQLYQISPSSSSSSASASSCNRSPSRSPLESAKQQATVATTSLPTSITVTPLANRHLLNQMNQMNLNELDLIVEEEPSHVETVKKTTADVNRAQQMYNSIANAKPVKSSTPTLAMQSNLQIAANQISTLATSGGGDDDDQDEWSSQQNIEDILYNSDETLSDYDDEDDDQDFENELEYDVDNDDQDLDEQDRRMLEYTEPGRRVSGGGEDVASVATNSREILIEREDDSSQQKHCCQPDRPLNCNNRTSISSTRMNTNYNRHTHQRIYRTKNENNKVIVEEIEEIDEEFNYNETKQPFEIQEQVENVDGDDVTLVDDDDDNYDEQDEDSRLKSNLNSMHRPQAASVRIGIHKPTAANTTSSSKIRIKNTRKKIK